MRESSKTTSYTECIHCHACQQNCGFLTKHDIVIGDIERLSELAYHCFLCGRCSRTCPMGIDGRGEILKLRCKHVEEQGDAGVKSEYKPLVREKNDYIYRNYRKAKPGVAYFPGCNFPSMYPKTNARLSEILAKHGISTIYDCCGKPISELGLKADEDRILRELNEHLANEGITEIVTACPNCFGYLEGKLDVKITSIYTLLKELGAGSHIPGPIKVFVPCPDRASHRWLEEIRGFVDGEISINENPQCCGLGGSALVKEPELAKKFAGSLNDAEDNIRTMVYCASCAGNFRRGGAKNVDHVITEIMGTGEKPDTLKSYVNRMLTKVK